MYKPSKTAVFDFGNTQIKFAFFEHGILKDFKTDSRENFDNLISICKKYEPHYVVSSSVLTLNDKEISSLKNFNFIELGSADKIKTGDLQVNYHTKQTLGIDRLANAMALFQYHPGINSLAIDCGTCIKYDFVTSGGVYEGGAISPGLLMRYKALNHYTAKLPLLNHTNEKIELTGKSTNNSIYSGVFNGILFEIEGFIKKYKTQCNEINIVFTGGDAHFFAEPLNYSIFADNFLTIKGINELLLLEIK